ncbi:asparagine synthase-related protein [Embleya sp. AB8]|uniref:asparagine synthase-related protein n=1 Tax=Embleya sp. AB8 TaxID=3156304 RepID=UPI003C74CF73
MNHPSGHPWLIGDWDAADFRLGEAGPVKVATLGFCSASSAELDEFAGGGNLTAWDDVHDGPAGCFHLFVTAHGTVRAHGSLSGLRRLVHARVDGLTIAATRADVLAAITDAQLDERRLVLRLLVSEAALHTAGDPLWRGLGAVPDDHRLLLDRQGRGRTVVRWQPPVDSLPLDEAADRLRVALGRAVRTRVDFGLPLSSDLSGGLDSTTLCFLAAGESALLTTFTTDTADPGDDDPRWANLAAEHLPGVRRLVVPGVELPTPYEDLLRPGPAGEEPFPGIEDRASYRAIATLLRTASARVHLTGDGGDEVVTIATTGVLDLLRARPLAALARLRDYRALEHWSWWGIGRMALDRRRAYPAWLADRAQRIVASSLDEEGSAILQLPPWATPDAVAIAREVIGAEAGRARRHGHNWTAHDTIWGIRAAGQLTRGTVPLYAAEGIRLTAPYLDDAVIDACMSARAYERRSPRRYKPLLVEAMRGIVPDRSLNRTTKAEGSSLEFTGIRRNIDQLAALCQDSRLASLGLVDADTLRAVCTGYQYRLFTPYALSTTFSCERWLRDLEDPVSVSASASGERGRIDGEDA